MIPAITLQEGPVDEKIEVQTISGEKLVPDRWVLTALSVPDTRWTSASTIRSDTLFTYIKGEPISIPFENITGIWVKRINKKTVMVITGLLLGSIVVFAVAWSQTPLAP